VPRLRGAGVPHAGLLARRAHRVGAARRRARDKEVALLRAALAERDLCLRQGKGELMGAP